MVRDPLQFNPKEVIGNVKADEIYGKPPATNFFGLPRDIKPRASDIINEALRKLGSDPVNSPSHYNQGGIECIAALRAATTREGFEAHCTLTAIKYLWRWQHKGGKQDLEKAKAYINFILSEEHQ
ncbi:DUF3310 domain-containing protein [Candidatus Dependentiae bacterium]|nr:MAG: DUF3310 domain-containing protein [Candidatus Dependentiae bacterium]